MRLRLLRIGETSVYVHMAMLALLIYMLLIGQGSILMIGMLSILLHEGAHAAASTIAGAPPEEMELSPLGAVMRLDALSSLTKGWQWIVLLAGPVMTLTICSAAIGLAQLGCLTLRSARQWFMCNLSLLLINLLPALPLDGGRMLALLLGVWMKPSSVAAIMRAVTTTIGLVCIGLNIWVTWRLGGWNLSLASIGCFMIYAGSTATVSTALYELQKLMDRRIRVEQSGSVTSACVTMVETLTVRQGIQRLHPRKHTLICVLSLEDERCKLIAEERLISVYLQNPSAILRSAFVKSE